MVNHNDLLPTVEHASNLALDRPASYRLLGLMLASVLVSLAVLFAHHPPFGWTPRLQRGASGGAGGAGERKGRKKAPHHLTIAVTDMLAGITLVNGLLAFFGA